jgi:hypothetical protein
MKRWQGMAMILCSLMSVAIGWAQDEPAEPIPAASAELLERVSERGPVKVRVALEPTQPVIGDALTLTLEVQAAQGVEVIMPEFGQSLDRFSIRDFVPRSSVEENGRTQASQRYTLSSPMSGPQYIPPIAIEFVDRRPGMRNAPEGEDAYEILTERLDFEVASVLPGSTAEALKPPLGELQPLEVGGPSQVWPWVLALITLAVVASLLGLRFWLAWRSRARRQSAYAIAMGRLDALIARPRPEGAEAVDSFFVELSDLVRHYLEDRFGLHAPELTTEEFLEVAAGSSDLGQAHQGFLQDFLRRADQVKFARYMPETDYMKNVLYAARRFLDQTRGEASRARATGADREVAHA